MTIQLEGRLSDTLRLLPEAYQFPRRVMLWQETVTDEAECLDVFERESWLDCFIQSHSNIERDQGILSLLFIDIDSEAIEKARSQALETARLIEERFKVKPQVNFSGNKGYHVLLPFSAISLPGGRYELEKLLYYLRFAAFTNYCDPQLAGDIVRLFRVIGSYNSKGIPKFCEGAKVTPIQEWNGNWADIRLIYGDFRVWLKVQELKQRNKEPIRHKRINGIRKPVLELIEKHKRGEDLLSSPVDTVP